MHDAVVIKVVDANRAIWRPCQQARIVIHQGRDFLPSALAGCVIPALGSSA